MKNRTSRVKPGGIARHLFGLILALVGLINWVALPGFASSGDASSSPVSSGHLTPFSLDAWTTNGPEGGSISSLAIDRSNPDIIYAGTIAGVSKSTDGGLTWNAFNTGISSTYIAAIAIDPSNPNTVHAGTDVGVFKSTDGGPTWSASNNGLPDSRSVRALSIDPGTSATLYIVAEGIIFKSINGGVSWSKVSDGLPSIPYGALAIDTVNTKVVYTCAYDYRKVKNRGVYKSTDGGASWSKPNKGFSNTLGYGRVLAIDPVNTDMIYAATSSGDNGFVSKSTDGGSSWSAINDGLKSFVVDAMAIDPANPNTVYAGTYSGGLFKSTNAGASWSTINTGLTHAEILALAIDPGGANTVYAGPMAASLEAPTAARIGVCPTPAREVSMPMCWRSPRVMQT